MLRYTPLAALALVACADVDPTLVDEASFERQRADSTTAADAPMLHADHDRPATHVGSVSLDGGHSLDQTDTLSTPGPGQTGIARPVAVVMVVDQNADMADVGHLLNEPSLVAIRQLSTSSGASFVGLVAHIDRRAHQIYPLLQVQPSEQRMLFGTAAGTSTCSTLDDLPGWAETSYDHPVFSAPSCWADELGRDPATALAFAQHMIEADAPPDAERAIILVGGRPPEDILAGERRPSDFKDQMPTWKRTDREVDANILEAHTHFIIDEIHDAGIRVLHVPLDPAYDDAWSNSLVGMGAERANGNSPHDRIESVRLFVEELQVAALE